MYRGFVANKVSVIMAIYNEPIEWIELAVDSILKQTYADFEFIIVNDKPDRKQNLDLLSKYSALDTRITIIDNGENFGLTKSLNKGLRLANGYYIARMDADDIAMPTRFEKQVEFLNKNEEYSACGTRAISIDESGKKNKILRKPIHNDEIRLNLIIGNPMIHPTMMIRSSIMRDNGLMYDETLRFAQDYDMVRNLIVLGKLHNLSEKLLYYRKSKKQITSVNLEGQNFCANQTRERLILQQLKTMDISLKTKDSFFDENATKLLNEIKGNKNIRANPFLRDVNIALLLNSEKKQAIKMILEVLLTNKTSIKNKLRLIIHIFK
ncbi:hypothetical protein CXF59_07035 [Flavobacterium sp. ALD4]|uniref:glycosyltransferase n=1 Tax=Flavobacterium sp. ALD4 TaxID=2058314 RepID=UPI000C33DDCE|nr:glycosyltransferase [Flavobacterium sp. ALD4]PKH67655.1 hypothetical protein CXF59_07035 [Flavobacterium sp. ALD4]